MIKALRRLVESMGPKMEPLEPRVRRPEPVTQAPELTQTAPKEGGRIVSYCALLMQGSREIDRAEGTGELQQALIADGYSRAIAVDLVPHWEAVLKDGLADYRADVTTFETIEKFGDTMQLKETYTVVIRVEFA